MKKYFLTSFLKYKFIIGLATLSFVTIMPTQDVHAGVFDWDRDIDMTITDVNGKKWRIKGSISGRGLSIKSYDIWVTDPDGNRHHFVKTVSIVPKDNGGATILIEVDGLGTVSLDVGGLES